MTEFEVRDVAIDGVGKWLWPKSDTELWEGPTADWKSHKHKILRHCKNFRVAVQAGGACGMYPRLLSNIFDTVYTFEPEEDNFLCLTKNCYGRKIIKFNAAIGAEPSLVSMRGVLEDNRGAASVEKRDSSFIPLMTIDQIQYRECSLLMIDVEGNEDQALKGAVETMNKFSPVVMVERGDRVMEFMKDIGYKAIDKSVYDMIFVKL